MRFIAEGPGDIFVSPANDYGTLVRNADDSYTYTAKDQTEHHFDLDGRLTSVVDTHGLARAYAYDASGRLINVTSPDGGVTTFTHDANGRIASITQPGNRVVTLTYDAVGDLVQITGPAGDERDFTYDAAHHLTRDLHGPLDTAFTYSATDGTLTSIDRGLGTVLDVEAAAVKSLNTTRAPSLPEVVAVLTDAAGADTTYTLDEAGRPLRQVLADGGLRTWDRLPDGQVMISNFSLWAYTETSYLYNASGDLLSIYYPEGAIQQFDYDPTFHHVTSSIDALGNETEWAYDLANGDLLTATDALGGETTYAWSVGLLQTATDPLGHVTSFTHDASRRLIAAEDALGGETAFAYDTAGNLVSATDALGRTTVLTYDGRGLPTSRTNALGGVETFGYDDAGHLVAATDALDRQTVLIYDQRGLLTSVTEATGTSVERTTTYGYDTRGNLASVTDGNGHTTTHTYDLLNRPSLTTAPDGGALAYAYDDFGRLESVTDARDNVTEYEYNWRNWRTLVRDALDGETLTAYNAEGDVTSVTDARGNTMSFGYDALRRPSWVTDAAGATSSMAYDAVGNLTSRTDPRGNLSTFVYDALSRLVGTEDALGGESSLAYDAVGNVTSSTDPRGNTTTFSYDALNRLTAAVAPTGATATITYNAVGNVLSTTDPRGAVTWFGYDALDRRITQTNALGGVAHWGYDGVANVTFTTDELGRTTLFAYDAADRPTELVDPTSAQSTFAYDATGNLVETTDTRGNTTAWEYDALNRPVERSNALGQSTLAEYDAVGNLIESTDPLANSWTWTYDDVNRVVEASDPLGRTTGVAYDAAGNVTGVTNARGFTTTATYDALNRLSVVENALGGETSFAYDAAGNLAAQTDALGRTTTFAYDPLNRLTSQSNALGATPSLAYDAAGNVTSLTDPLGYQTSFTYDLLGRRTTVTDALNQVSTTAYDAASQVIAYTDSLGRQTTMAYDDAGRPIQQVAADGGITSLAYDATGNVTAVTDPAGNVTSYLYDVLNRRTSRTDALNASTLYEYDVAGRLDAVVDRNGRTREFTYDAAGQLTTEVWRNIDNTIADTLAYGFDANGNVLTASNGNGAYAMTYDALDRLTAQGLPFGLSLTMAYDAVGNRVQVADSLGGVVDSTYDALDRLVQRDFSGTGQTPLRLDLAYNARNEVTALTRYADLTGLDLVGSTTYTHDGLGRLTGLQHRDDANANLANYAYSYDAASRLLSETLDGVTVNYTYDAMDQLTGDGVQSYTYDANGNRTMSGYATGTGNRLQSDGTWSYTYDAEGNLIKKSQGVSAETWTYGYDHRNQLTWAELRATDGGTLLERVDYDHDVWGNRLQRQVTPASGPVQTERFAYDGANAWADLDGSNQLVMRRLYLDAVDTLYARIGANDEAAWYLTDRMGSVRQILDDTGAVVDTLTYDGFGNVLSESDPSVGDRYRYTGREADGNTGLQYHRARYYDPAAGRWTTEDPIGFAAGDANLYRYVGNATTQFTDPSGLEANPNSSYADVLTTEGIQAGPPIPADQVPQPAAAAQVGPAVDDRSLGRRLTNVWNGFKETPATLSDLVKAQSYYWYMLTNGYFDDRNLGKLSPIEEPTWNSKFVQEFVRIHRYEGNEAAGRYGLTAMVVVPLEVGMNVLTFGGYGVVKAVSHSIETGDPTMVDEAAGGLLFMKVSQSVTNRAAGGTPAPVATGNCFAAGTLVLVGVDGVNLPEVVAAHVIVTARSQADAEGEDCQTVPWADLLFAAGALSFAYGCLPSRAASCHGQRAPSVHRRIGSAGTGLPVLANT